MFGNWRHICVDMQRMFAEDTPWRVPWMETVCPQVIEVCSRHSHKTVFTRFIPPASAGDVAGMWQRYYEKWWMMTSEHLPPEFFDVVPALAKFVPPAVYLDKCTYSPWIDGRLHAALLRDSVDTLILSGGETDVCVLATAMGGIDLGYRIIILQDAVCSGADETYDASLKLLGDRFSVQLDLMSTEEFMKQASTYAKNAYV
ncbi:MAG: isochorismatase family protein [Rhizobium sp.]|nr:isochorismatase family protein [Rhizobium sp.]